MNLTTKIKKLASLMMGLAAAASPMARSRTVSRDYDEQEIPLFVAIRGILIGVVGVIFAGIIVFALISLGIDRLLGK